MLLLLSLFIYYSIVVLIIFYVYLNSD